MGIAVTKRTGGFTIQINSKLPIYASSINYYSTPNGVKLLLPGQIGELLTDAFNPGDWTIQTVTGFTTNLQVADALDGLGVVSSDTLIGIKAAQTNGTQKAQTVDPSGINSESIIRTFGLTLTRPANQTAYTAGDVIGDVSGAMPMFSNVAKAAGYGVAILGVRAQTNDTGLAGKALNVSFYNSALTTVIADNEPFVMADENAEKREGNVTLTFGSGILAKVSQNLDERIILNPVGRSIGCVPVTTAGHTPSADSTWIKLYIKCLLTN